jgi:hypothetical protein
MAKKWMVTLPLTGTITVQVEAENERDAIDTALEGGDFKTENINEWEVVRQIVRGNVFSGLMNSAEAEEVEP